MKYVKNILDENGCWVVEMDDRISRIIKDNSEMLRRMKMEDIIYFAERVLEERLKERINKIKAQ